MRGNSGYLRWTSSQSTMSLALLVVLCNIVITEAGPTRNRRQLIASAEIVPHSSPTEEKCMQNGLEVVRSSVQCETKTGCRKIEIRDECCPVYKCDCQFNNKTLENNEKISDPSKPCNVCLCRAGEIKCTEVTCYNRNDCATKTFVPGVCCPLYDNCPPLDDNHLGASAESTTTAPTPSTKTTSTPFNTVNKEPLLDAVKAVPTNPDPAVKPFSDAHASVAVPLNDNPLGITIKEITKPEEIRITDDKPKLYKPPVRTTTAASLSSTTVAFVNDAPSSTVDEFVAVAGSEPILAEDADENAASSGDEAGEILPEDWVDDVVASSSETPPTTTSTSSVASVATVIDELSEFDNNNAGQYENSVEVVSNSGVKIIRQIEGEHRQSIDNIVDLYAAATSTAPDVQISDKLSELSAERQKQQASSSVDSLSVDEHSSESTPTSTAATSDDLFSSTSTTYAGIIVATTEDNVDNATAEENIGDNSQLICINGKPFKLRETDGLERGNDDEDAAPKVGGNGCTTNASPAAATDYETLTTLASVVVADTTESAFSLASSASSSSVPSIVVDSSSEASGFSQVFEAVYYEPVSEDSVYMSGEIVSGESVESSESREPNKMSSQEDYMSMTPVKFATSSEMTIGGGWFDGSGSDGSGSGSGNGANIIIGSYADEKDSSVEGSALPMNESSGDSDPIRHVYTGAESTSMPTTTTATSTVVVDDDKTREFPEQSDDYSLHSQMQQLNEEHAKSAATGIVAETGSESSVPEVSAFSDDDRLGLDADSTGLRVIPIGTRLSDIQPATSSPPTEAPVESSSVGSSNGKVLSGFSDAQERTPGEPHLVPEWERNTTTTLRVNRNESTILLPVDSDANDASAFGRRSTTSSEEEDGPSSSSPQPLDGGIAEATTAGLEHLSANEVVRSVGAVQSAELRSIDDGFNVDQSKQSYYLRGSGEFLRYQDKIMSS